MRSSETDALFVGLLVFVVFGMLAAFTIGFLFGWFMT